MSHIRWLGDEDCHETAVVGGKAANLSRLVLQHRVPLGFAIPAQPVIPGDPVPVQIVATIHEAYRRLAERTGEATPSVAVRSSALDEDGACASFAGQHDTYLNISGEDAVVDAVARYWHSAHSPAALAYRKQQGLSKEDIRIAVLVQLLIASDVSAVVFSSNPLTKSDDEVVINASWGLGESVVGGTVTPDTYVVRKSDLRVASRQIADKRQMTVLVPGGTKEVPVPRLLSKEPALNDLQAAEMAGLAVQLTETTGWPVDIECTIAAGELYLLQCRPITTLGT